MARSTTYICGECGAAHPKWTGRCSDCSAWNTLAEASAERPDRGGRRPSGPVRLHEVPVDAGRPMPTGIDELDRVLGGGLVPGSVTLIGGEPGIGKSTLLLQLLGTWHGPTLYVSAEESGQQVQLRAERLGIDHPDLWILAEVDLPSVLAAVDRTEPGLLVVDSIQTMSDPEVGSASGSVAQVRACTHRLVALAKQRGIPVVIVGHVTKEGGLAGPRVLEHVVDTVLTFEGDRHHALRLLRAVKHRFGPTGELGVFEMTGDGLRGVPDASALFLTDRRTGVAGSAVLATMEGPRPLVVEIQALASPIGPGMSGRRTTQGIDGSRLAMLLAVLDRRVGLPAIAHDVYASTVGGIRLTEPGLDLALCAAVTSTITGRPLPADLAVMGEVGLAGEVRQVSHPSRRLAEIARLGFRRALVPTNTPVDDTFGLQISPATCLTEALAIAGLFDDAGPGIMLHAV